MYVVSACDNDVARVCVHDVCGVGMWCVFVNDVRGTCVGACVCMCLVHLLRCICVVFLAMYTPNSPYLG